MNTLQVSVLKTGAYLLLRLIVCQRSEEFIAASQTSLTSPPEQRSPKGLQQAGTHPSLYVTHRQSFTGGHPAVSVPRSRKLHVLGEQHPWLSATSMATKKPLCDSIVVCVFMGESFIPHEVGMVMICIVQRRNQGTKKYMNLYRRGTTGICLPQILMDANVYFNCKKEDTNIVEYASVLGV